MSKIAVMGDRDSIYGFRALGLETFTVTDIEEGAKLLKRLADNGYGVIYMITPAIILIPGVFGNTGEGIARVKGSVEQAVGSDILFGNE